MNNNINLYSATFTSVFFIDMNLICPLYCILYLLYYFCLIITAGKYDRAIVEYSRAIAILPTHFRGMKIIDGGSEIRQQGYMEIDK